MQYNGLGEFVEQLIRKNQLIVINEYVNPELEITEITDRYSKSLGGGKALLFKNNGTQFPLLINSLGNNERINLALNMQDSNEFANRITELLNSIQNQPENFLQKIQLLPKLAEIGRLFPKKKKGKGECQQIIQQTPNLNTLPILKCWPFDGGRFITLPIVHTVDPHNKMRNIGMYRMQQISSNTTGMHWHKHKVGARHFKEYKAQKKNMPVSVILGGDPVYTYAATAPAPDNFDEYIIAGFIRNRPVELVKCITNDIYVPSDADIVIEGYIDTSEEFVTEGPFGDHTGFYSLADLYPLFHVTCITHRRNAIYPATIVGIPPMEDAFMGEISEKIFLKPLQLGIAPDVVDMHMPIAGVVHNLVIVSANINYEGQAFKIANALWGAGQMMFTKYIVVVDKHIDIRNYTSVIQSIEQNVDFSEDLLYSKGPLDVLDHASKDMAVGGKLCVDATLKSNRKSHNRPIAFDLKGYEHKSYSEKITFVFTDNPALDHKELLTCNTSASGLLIFVEKDLLELNFFTLLWYVLGNTDPIRDTNVLGNLMLVDALKKHKRQGFNRSWPDLVVMDDKTIENIDNRWEKLSLGSFIESPSKILKRIAVEKGAEL